MLFSLNSDFTGLWACYRGYISTLVQQCWNCCPTVWQRQRVIVTVCVSRTCDSGHLVQVSSKSHALFLGQVKSLFNNIICLTCSKSMTMSWVCITMTDISISALCLLVSARYSLWMILVSDRLNVWKAPSTDNNHSMLWQSDWSLFTVC